MTRRNACLAVLGLLGCFTVSAGDFHIDPSRTEGCPGTGTVIDPHCDWDEIAEFVGGNRYLQKRATTFEGMILLTPGRVMEGPGPVVIGAYGVGSRPVIRVGNALPGANIASNWSPVGRGVWVFSTAGFREGNPAVVLLDGRRALGGARNPGDVCMAAGAMVVEWHHGDGALRLCSPRGNPAQVFRTIVGMQLRSREPWAPIYIEGQRGIVIEGLTIEGGRWGAVEIRGSSSAIEIRHCEIGRYSASGIHAHSMETPITGLEIHDNVIDSGIRWGSVRYEPVVSGEGIHFNAGVQNSRVYRNLLVAWPHNGMYLDAHLPGSPGVVGNVIFDNEFHCGPNSSYFDYCRPFGIDGASPGAAQYNLVFRNRLHDFSVGSQVNGNNNHIVGNFCFNVTSSKARRDPTGTCFRMQPYLFSKDNLIANNTMVGTADAAVEVRPGTRGVAIGHRIIGNIMYDCGRDTATARRGVCVDVAHDQSIGPQTVVGNLIFNPNRPTRVRYREAGIVDANAWRPSGNDTIAANRVADPKFDNQAEGLFTLESTSPAVGAGRPLVVPRLELRGRYVNIGASQSVRTDERQWKFVP